MKRMISALLRSQVSRLGYVMVKRDFTRFGYSLFTDIRRISKTWDWSIQTVFDVGANIGQFASETLRELPDTIVHSFEPHPRAFAKLSRSISGPRLSAHEWAVGDREGEAVLYVYGSDKDGSLINSLTPDARFPQKFGYQAREVKVRCTTIDAFCREAEVERIDLLKVDTEGFDLFVLRGAERMLREGRVRFVYVEFNDLFAKDNATGGALVPIAEYLEPFGFAYLCTYTDFVLYEGKVSVCANALFAVPPVQAR
jgi:FkbM family methyltransferase